MKKKDVFAPSMLVDTIQAISGKADRQWTHFAYKLQTTLEGRCGELFKCGFSAEPTFRIHDGGIGMGELWCTPDYVRITIFPYASEDNPNAQRTNLALVAKTRRLLRKHAAVDNFSQDYKGYTLDITVNDTCKPKTCPDENGPQWENMEAYRSVLLQIVDEYEQARYAIIDKEFKVREARTKSA